VIGHLLKPELEELIVEKRWDVLRDALSNFHPSDITEILVDVPEADYGAIFRILPRGLAGQVFSYLPQSNQEALIRCLTNDQMRSLLSQMTPDDRTQLLEELPPEVTRRLLELLSPAELQKARDLLGYPDDTAGQYMTPKYVAIRHDMTAAEALDYIRRTGRDKETVNVVYVLDRAGTLTEDLSLGSLVMAEPECKVSEIPSPPLISIKASTDREEVLRTFEKYDTIALPVTDNEGHMLGIITVDDILDVARREATEDIQKIGGMEALDAPYPQVGLAKMVRKRGGWLSILFLGEMLTATAMGYFQEEIAHAVVLALFVPLIISSGGNSGSQASTLIVRSLALGELKLRQWLYVLGRELLTSFTLGTWLGFIGFVRIVLWQWVGWIDYNKVGGHLSAYGDHLYLLVAVTVWLSLVGVVMFGSVTGSMLPFLLRRLGFDPATSSAPFVATLVDVTGLLIYFTIALVILRQVMH
jgi:magnesium transporter